MGSAGKLSSGECCRKRFSYTGVPTGEWSEPLYDPHMPKVFRGAAKDWPCVRKWSFDYFAEKYGDTEVVLYNSRGLTDESSDQNFDHIQLREYIELMKAGSKKYLKFSRMVHDTSELRDDFDYNWLEKFHRPGAFGKVFYLFMGGAGTKTPIHNAPTPTVFVQIVGEKKWTLYPVEDRIFLGPRPERRGYFFTKADPDNRTGNECAPLLKYAASHTLTLYPGDVLWFPSFVWHKVENLTNSVGVGYKFNHIGSALKGSRMLSTLFALQTKPLLIESLIMARIKKNDYIFLKEN